MPCDYEVFPTPREAAAAAAQAIEKQLASALTARDHATLAISGGSTPKLMFESLREAPIDWRRVHFFWVDERLVPPGHADSNYRLARESLSGAFAEVANNSLLFSRVKYVRCLDRYYAGRDFGCQSGVADGRGGLQHHAW